MTKAVVVMSGGLDSTTLLYQVLSDLDGQQHEVDAISFYYGQRHHKELDRAELICNQVHVRRQEVNISWLSTLFAESGSSLITRENVPEGHYAQENMKATVVPNRNMIMASIAAGYAISVGAEALYMGVHAGDHFIYPDCRPRFFNALNAAVVLGNAGFGTIEETAENCWPADFVLTPFINLSKNDIAARAHTLNVPIADTWSCYKGGTTHCGRCGTCVERREALESTGLEDPTQYEDRDYWKQALAERAADNA